VELVQSGEWYRIDKVFVSAFYDTLLSVSLPRSFYHVTIQFKTIQYNTVQYSTVQYSTGTGTATGTGTVQYSTWLV